MMCTPIIGIEPFEVEKPTLLVMLGDSIAAGYGVQRSQRYGYIVADRMGWEYWNYAVSGSQTSGLLDKLLNSYPTQNAVRNADIIHISIGGNDLVLTPEGSIDLLFLTTLLGMQATPQLDAKIAVAVNNFNQSISKIRELNPNALITVLKNIIPSFGPLGVVHNAAAFAIDRLTAAMFASHTDLLIINGRAHFLASDTDYFLPDFIHLSPLGHSHLAKIFYDTYNEFISQTGNTDNTLLVVLSVIGASVLFGTLWIGFYFLKIRNRMNQLAIKKDSNL